MKLSLADRATLHQLRVFAAAARCGSFTKAAEVLHVTQPTVSGQIKQLTKAAKTPLFEQIGKQLYLTEAGRILLVACDDIFDRLDRLDAQIADLQGTKRGRLRLAAVTTTQYFIPRLLGAFCQTYPGIEVTLQVTNHQQLLERMADNEDDLYILSHADESLDLKLEPFLDNPLVVLARPDHPLAEQADIPLDALEGETFVMREAGSGTRRAVESLFTTYEVSVRVRLELGSNEAILQAIAGGLGISVLSDRVLVSEETAKDLIVLPVRHFPIQRYWYIAHLSGKALSVAAQTFLSYLTEHAERAMERYDRDSIRNRLR